MQAWPKKNSEDAAFAMATLIGKGRETQGQHLVKLCINKCSVTPPHRMEI